jgi:hypothetical protein
VPFWNGSYLIGTAIIVMVSVFVIVGTIIYFKVKQFLCWAPVEDAQEKYRLYTQQQYQEQK